jgi:hypothetical protein
MDRRVLERIRCIGFLVHTTPVFRVHLEILRENALRSGASRLRLLFQLPLRHAEGFLCSLLELMA